MATEDQEIDIPIVGGLDDKTDARLTMKMVDVHNARYTKTGGLRKRLGTTRVGTYNSAYTSALGLWAGPDAGGSLATPEALIPHGDALYRVGGNGLFRKVAPDTSSDWSFQGYVPGVTARQRGIFLAPVTPVNAQVAYVTSGSKKYLVYVAAGSLSTVCNIYDLTNGTSLSRDFIASGTSTGGTSTPADVPKIVVCGTKVIFLNFINGQTTLYATSWDASTGLWGAANTDLLAGLGYTIGTAGFDAVALTSTTFAIFFELSAGANRQKVISFNTSFVLQTNRTLATATTGIIARSMAFTAGDSTLWVAYGYAAGGNGTVKVEGLNPTTLATTVGPDTALSSAPNAAPLNVVLCRLTSTSCMVGWTRYHTTASARPLCFEYLTYNTSASLGTARTCIRLAALSRPWVTNDSRVLMLAHYSSSALLVELDATNGFTRHVCVVAPRQLADNATSITGRANGSTSDVATLSSPEAYVVCMPRNVAGTGTSTFSVEAQSVTFYMSNDTTSLLAAKPVGAELNGDLLVSGGCISNVSGGGVTEANVLGTPNTNEITLTAGGGGSMGAGTYSYAFVWETVDAQGNVLRSAPVTKSAGAVSGSGSVAIVCPTLNIGELSLAQKGRAGMSMIVYRTEANGSIYYRCTTMTNVRTSDTMTVTDTTVDSGITSNPQLYTTGNVLSNVVPSGARYIATWRNCVVLVDTPDDLIWFSKAAVQGEAIAFADTNTIQPFEGGRAIAGMGLDDKFIVFKASSVWCFTGTPPDDLGNSSLSDPQLVSSDVGISDPRSLVHTSQGLVFQGSDGRVYRLNRSLQIEPVGGPVEDKTRNTSDGSARQISTAVLVPYANGVRYTLTPDSTAVTSTNCVEFDTYQSQQDNVWTRHCYLSPSAGTALTINGACMWGGKWTFIDSSGYLYQEDLAAQYYDRIDTNTYQYVTATGLTQWVKLTGIQGYQRLKRVSVLAEAKTKSTLRVRLWPDYNTGATPQSGSWNYASATTVAQNEVHVAAQKTESVQIEFSDQNNSSSGSDSGQGLVFSGVRVKVGPKKGPYKLPAASKA